MKPMGACCFAAVLVGATPCAAFALWGEEQVTQLTKSSGGTNESASVATSYTYTDCQGNSKSCNLHSTWPSWPGCPGISPWPERCHQATLATAQAICSANAGCMGITRDAAGYEPRTGPSIYYHGAAKEMWIKNAEDPTPNPTVFPTPFPTSFPTAFPTPFPTSFPTPYPTAFPTPFPTPSPTTSPVAPNSGGNSVAATGDPHLQNVHGEWFDLMKPGDHVLINIPRGVIADDALLRVQAKARRLGGHCADMYFQTLNITGSWAESKQAGGYCFSASQSAVETPQWIAFGPVQLKVVHGHTGSGFQYLNMFAKHLGRAGFAIGGLLGEDDHEGVISPTGDCDTRTELSSAPANMTGRSHSMASVAQASFA
ncbi:unnamed protein product [Prorocentrum cordatum]|uniref:Uncharacterized protein n=1 Tax=Prorocentrum cordatum TaxID=2364126 RepID=A0ABN9PND8_9DINO|nr:unnamed protein product [Polarella glacialis]